jgi:chromosome condensin MukBEF MukE localization factor
MSNTILFKLLRTIELKLCFFFLSTLSLDNFGIFTHQPILQAILIDKILV